MDSVYLCYLWENKTKSYSIKAFSHRWHRWTERTDFLFAHWKAQRPKGRRIHRFIVDELTSGQVNQLIVDRVIEDKVTEEQSSFE